MHLKLSYFVQSHMLIIASHWTHGIGCMQSCYTYLGWGHMVNNASKGAFSSNRIGNILNEKK